MSSWWWICCTEENFDLFHCAKSPVPEYSLIPQNLRIHSHWIEGYKQNFNKTASSVSEIVSGNSGCTVHCQKLFLPYLNWSSADYEKIHFIASVTKKDDRVVNVACKGLTREGKTQIQWENLKVRGHLQYLGRRENKIKTDPKNGGWWRIWV